MYSYCLFCETGKGDYVVRAAMQVFACTAISPKQIQHTWDKGQFTDRARDFLPGYVFIYSEEPIHQPQDIRRKLDRIIRSLRTTDLDYRLHGADEEFAMMLYNKKALSVRLWLQKQREGSRSLTKPFGTSRQRSRKSTAATIA